MNNPAPIKVLLVDDSPLALTILKRIFSSSPEIEVVGTAPNGKEALELVSRLKPTVICTDLHMPVMDGLEFTKRAMAEHPTPILVVSVSVREGSANVFNLLEAGAIDMFQKPRGGLDSDAQIKAAELIQKVRILAGVKVFRRHQKKDAVEKLKSCEDRLRISTSQLPNFATSAFRIVVIGASTGGPQALQAILPLLPADFPLPVVCIQHISSGFLTGLVDWISSQCRMRVELAKSGRQPMPGTIYFPEEDTHLEMDEEGRFVCSRGTLFYGHRPSVTVTMRSIAGYYGSGVIAVLLTGMGNDGAEGMKSVADAGGITVAQDEDTSVVFGMPQQALKLGAVKHVLPLEGIGGFLLSAGNQCSPKTLKAES